RRGTCAGGPPARGSTRPCRGGRRHRVPRRRPPPRTPRAPRSAPPSAAARRATRATSPRRRPSRRSGRAPRCGRRALGGRWSRGRERAVLRTDAVEELGERVRELLHTLELERLGDVVVVDADLRDLLEQRVRRLDVLLDGVAAHLAVVLERGDGLDRHRVDRVRPDQLLDVDHVTVLWVLRRRRRPQTALRRRALAGEELPARPAELALIVLVRELRVRDRELPAERERLVRPDLLEPLVRLGVDARHEEAGDAVDLRGIAAAGDEPLEAA